MLFISVLSVTVGMAQENEKKQYIHKHLLRATMSFELGNMPKEKINNAYLNGNLEYYFDNKISVRGEASMFFNSLNNKGYLKANHQLLSGAVYHFKTNNFFDPYFGLQTGAAYIEVDPAYLWGSGNSILFTKISGVNPLVSPLLGFNFYASKIFHLFINARYVYMQSIMGIPEPILPFSGSPVFTTFNPSEFRFTFGLGFNIL